VRDASGKGHADRSGDLGLEEPTQDGFRDGLGLRLRRAGEDDQELIARGVEPNDVIDASTDRATEHRRCPSDVAVAGNVATSVVDGLEVVQVDDDRGERRGRTAHQHRPALRVEVAPAHKARERIEHADPLQRGEPLPLPEHEAKHDRKRDDERDQTHRRGVANNQIDKAGRILAGVEQTHSGASKRRA
jgi:hypothetical protein